MGVELVEDIQKPNEFVKVTNALEKKSSGYSNDELNDYISKFLDMSNNAKDNDQKEKSMSLMEGLRTFPKATMWSVILSSAIIMEGYDTYLIGAFYAFPSFQKRYGKYYADKDEYQVPAKWQTVLTMTTNIGEIIGLFAAGIIADKFGFRKTMIGCLVLVIGLIFIVFFSNSIGMLVAGEMLLGIPWGAFQTLTISYASEVCPLVLRIYLTTYVNVCWVIGSLIGSGVMRGLVNSTIKDAYRIPFAIQWFWPIPILIGIFLAPESPWWLAKNGKIKEAKLSLKRLLTENKDLPNKEILAEGMLQKMQMTIKEEDSINKGVSASYWDCFKGNDLRRTRVASITWLIQNITGSSLMGSSTYFYEQAGLSTSMSFTFAIIQMVVGIIGTISSWFISQKLGRFQIYFYGLCLQSVILITVGGLGFSDNTGVSWAIGSLLWVFTFVYDCSIGPLCYCIVAELPSVRLRTKTVIIARNIYNVAGIVVGVINPYMLNPTAWDWKAKSGLLWAGLAVCSAIWAFFELPETQGRTFAEIDALFRQGVSARKFKSTEVEVFDAGELLANIGEEEVRDFVDKNKEAESFPEKV